MACRLTGGGRWIRTPGLPKGAKMVIEGREADHDDRYRTGERSGLRSNLTALKPTEQRIGLTARIFEYRAPLDEIVEVARRCGRLDLMDVDQLIARIVDGA